MSIAAQASEHTDNPLYVNAHGQRLDGWKEGAFPAKTPVSYRFGGTIPGFQPGRDPIDNQARFLKFVSHAARNAELLEQAVFDLSQSPDGRRLLDAAHRNGFSIVFDQNKVGERNAAGLCDIANKIVPLSPQTTVPDLVLTLKHELQHMEDMLGAKDHPGHDASLARRIAATRGFEASARVSEALTVIETERSGKSQAYVPMGLRAAFTQSCPSMMQAADKAMAVIDEQQRTKSPETNTPWQVRFAEMVFVSFWSEKATLVFYDKDTIREANRALPPAPAERRADTHYAEQRFKNYMQTLMSTDKPVQPAMQKALKTGGFAFLSDKILNLDDSKIGAAVRDPATVKAHQDLNEAIQARLTTLKSWGQRDLPQPQAEVMFSDQVGPPVAEIKHSVFGVLARPLGALARKLGIGGATPPQIVPAVPEPAVLASIVMPQAIRQMTAPDWDANAYARFAEAGVAEKGVPGYEHRSGLEHLHSTLERMHYDYRAPMIRTTIIPLLDQGLRAPIAAFPTDYIVDIATRMQSGATRSHDGIKSDFSPGEAKLIEHWQKLAKSGISPVDGGYQRGSQAHTPIGMDTLAFAGEIAKAIPVDPTAKGNPVLMTGDAMRDSAAGICQSTSQVHRPASPFKANRRL